MAALKKGQVRSSQRPADIGAKGIGRSPHSELKIPPISPSCEQALTLYNWKAKYGGLTVSEAKRLKSLEDENTKLKKLSADSMLDNAALKELLSKNW
jgi:hypothetical protein